MILYIIVEEVWAGTVVLYYCSRFCLSWAIEPFIQSIVCDPSIQNGANTTQDKNFMTITSKEEHYYSMLHGLTTLLSTEHSMSYGLTTQLSSEDSILYGLATQLSTEDSILYGLATQLSTEDSILYG